MKSIKIIINEQHSLLTEQKEIVEGLLKREVVDSDFSKIPADGMKIEELRDLARSLKGHNVVFVSPIPALIKFCTAQSEKKVHIMHNDRREKKELPNGKVISVTAKTGWQLI